MECTTLSNRLRKSIKIQVSEIGMQRQFHPGYLPSATPRDPAPQAPATKIPYYLRLLSYMLLDWAQILKGSGFLARVPSTATSCWGRPGSGWTGAGGAAVSVDRACEAWRGEESEGALRWLETLC